MVISIRKLIENAYCEYPTTERTVWVQKWPGQCILCVSQMFWTAEVHDVFATRKSGKMRNYHDFLTVFNCIYFTKMIIFELNIFFFLQNQLHNVVDLVRGKLNRQTRISLCALVTLDVHCRDVVRDLANNNITDDMDFKWLSQLRWGNEYVFNLLKINYNYSYLIIC